VYIYKSNLKNKTNLGKRVSTSLFATHVNNRECKVFISIWRHGISTLKRIDISPSREQPACVLLFLLGARQFILYSPASGARDESQAMCVVLPSGGRNWNLKCAVFVSNVSRLRRSPWSGAAANQRGFVYSLCPADNRLPRTSAAAASRTLPLAQFNSLPSHRENPGWLVANNHFGNWLSSPDKCLFKKKKNLWGKNKVSLNESEVTQRKGSSLKRGKGPMAGDFGPRWCFPPWLSDWDWWTSWQLVSGNTYWLSAGKHAPQTFIRPPQ